MENEFQSCGMNAQQNQQKLQDKEIEASLSRIKNKILRRRKEQCGCLPLSGSG